MQRAIWKPTSKCSMRPQASAQTSGVSLKTEMYTARTCTVKQILEQGQNMHMQQNNIGTMRIVACFSAKL